MCNKVESGEVKLQKIEEEIPIDNFIDKYMEEVKNSVKTVKKAHIKLNKGEEYKNYSVNLNSQNPIYQALKLTPISELDYIV